jgi:hypothetical protein
MFHPAILNIATTTDLKHGAALQIENKVKSSLMLVNASFYMNSA